MCKSAEYISCWCGSGSTLTNIGFDDFKCPETFKPGVADKFMFNRIIDSVIDNIYDELKKCEKLGYENYDAELNGLTGVNIMARFYYPYYANWRKIDTENVEKFWGL